MRHNLFTSSGYPLYELTLGIIMLDCKFPRLTGDIGNMKTFPFPVQYEVLFDVDFVKLIHEEDPEAVNKLVDAALRLERMGVRAIMTSCGLLLKYQALLTEKLNIPVVTSAVLLLPFLRNLARSQDKVLVVCSNSHALSSQEVSKFTGVEEENFKMAGLETCPTFNAVFNIQESMATVQLDEDMIYAEILREIRGNIFASQSRGETVTSILLECTNLGPYRSSLKRDLGMPVFDFLSLAQLIYSGIM